MKQITTILLILAALALTGCKTKNAHNTDLPWSRPAPWQDQTPGVAF